MKGWAGVDPGQRRIGVARSDPLGTMGLPAAIVRNREELVRLLEEWIEEGRVAGVVVGLPRNMDGSYGPMARRSMDLVRALRQELSVDIRLWDERLTTEQVKRAGFGRRGEPVDHQVAALILQSFLDAGAPEASDPAELAGQ